MQIKSVAVLGAGAVGSYVIWGLSSRKDIRLAVIAEGPRAERLKQQGITINGTTYRPQVWTPQEANGVDLLVVALKYGALPGALDSIAAAVGPDTTVMSLMNGVDSEEIIAAKIGAEHVLPSLIKVASHKEADGYHFNPETTIGIIYGELAVPLKSERVQAVEALLAGTGIHSRVTPYIKEEIWSKFRLNVCNNLPQAILGVGVGCEVKRETLHEADDFAVTEAFVQAVNQSIDLVFLCQPNNPTGQITPPELVQRLVRRCADCGAVLVVDECFLDFLQQRDALTAKPLLQAAPNLVILKAFTKLYAMAGVRLGYALCANTALLAKMQAAGQPWGVSSLAQAAGAAALRETAYADAVRALIADQRPKLAAGLRALGLQVIEGRANYLLFRAPETLGTALQQRGVCLRSCGNYPGLSAGWYRTAVRTAPENEQLLQTMREVLK